MKYKRQGNGNKITFTTEPQLKRLDRAQKRLGWRVADDMAQYVPEETGYLAGRPFTHPSELDRGHLIWDAVQARNLFEGFVMIGTDSGKVWANKGEKKRVTDQRYQFKQTFHPLATSKWTVEGVRNHKEEWREDIQRFVEGKP